MFLPFDVPGNFHLIARHDILGKRDYCLQDFGGRVADSGFFLVWGWHWISWDRNYILIIRAWASPVRQRVTASALALERGGEG